MTDNDMTDHIATPAKGLKDAETIVAISTPPGRGGIGIVRLSGPQAWAIAAKLVRSSSADGPEHARARLAAVLGADGGVLDQALVTVFHAPHSYTGEQLVEIAAHGSPPVLQALVQAAMQRGARLAMPGEFTQRAFLAGRIDLTQAEAVHDLIAAQSLEQARAAAQQMGGALSRRAAPAKETLLHLVALLEAGMDFASGELDDVDVVPAAQIAAAIAAVRGPLVRLAASWQQGQLLRNGAAVALVGRPNAGKSSLFNRLLERERAIVTAMPGTTRDTVEEAVTLGGVPVRLIDTAGLRMLEDGPDEAEQLGMARSREALADADLVLLVCDATLPASTEEMALLDGLDGRPHLLVRNKIDLLGERDEAAGIATSALTGEGLGELRSAILQQLGADVSVAEGGQLNTLRQREAVSAALEALEAAGAANHDGLPHEVLLLDLHSALRALDSLTGQTTTEEILGRIFATFCIGK